MKQSEMLKKSLALLAAVIFMGTAMYAQPGNGKGQCTQSGEPQCFKFIPDLSDNQKAEIKKLHTEHLQKMIDYKNQLGEKHAKLQTLETAKDPDMKAINTLIDDMTNVKNEMLKERASHKQAVRKLLNDDQRVAFDAHKSKMGKGMQGHHGKGQCNKPCGKQ